MICSKCHKENDRKGQRYCRACHAEYMRSWRPKYSELSEQDRQRSNCRAKANVYQRRGLLKPEPCHDCGSEKDLQKHHEDYSKPLLVTWLCRKCHIKRHQLD